MAIWQLVCNIGKYCLWIIILNFNKSNSAFISNNNYLQLVCNIVISLFFMSNYVGLFNFQVSFFFFFSFFQPIMSFQVIKDNHF